MIYVQLLILLIIGIIAFIFLGKSLEEGLSQENNYIKNKMHDDMFFEYIESVDTPTEEGYSEFKKNWYNTEIKRQEYFK